MKKAQKKKVKDTIFKPEANQPGIKNIIMPKIQKDKLDKNKQNIQPVQKVHKTGAEKESTPNPNQSLSKKREPPTPPDKENPSKRINMLNPDDNKQQNEEPVTSHNGKPPEDIGDNTDSDTEPDKFAISPELLKLHEMLKKDMQKLLIKPLEDRMTVLEQSHTKLEEKGELICEIKKENVQLKRNCEAIMAENSHLKTRIDNIEKKLMSNNVILHGISDQQWELSTVTREKALMDISNIANGKTPEEKLNIVWKIGFRDIRRLGEFREH